MLSLYQVVFGGAATFFRQQPFISAVFLSVNIVVRGCRSLYLTQYRPSFRESFSLIESYASILRYSEYMKDRVDLNCGERYEDMIDHRSYMYNLSSR